MVDDLVLMLLRYKAQIIFYSFGEVCPYIADCLPVKILIRGSSKYHQTDYSTRRLAGQVT
jgi:hypothetical protein